MNIIWMDFRSLSLVLVISMKLQVMIVVHRNDFRDDEFRIHSMFRYEN